MQLRPLSLRGGEREALLVSRLAALCLFLSTIEFLIPKPLPFLRLGLANAPLILALNLVSPTGYLALCLIKTVGQAIISGTLFSYIFLFSAVGTASSAISMFMLSRLFRHHISSIGISVAGASASNAAQLLLARFLIFGESVMYMAPPILFAGLISGGVLGALTGIYTDSSSWYKETLEGRWPPQHIDLLPPEVPQNRREEAIQRLKIPFSLLLAGFLLFSDSLLIKSVTTLCAAILLCISGKKIRILPTITITSGILFFNLLLPFGRVLAEPFGLPITEGALYSGIKKALVLEGMIFLSRWLLVHLPRLPGTVGALMSQTLAFLAYLTEHRSTVSRKHLVASIDALMYGHDQVRPEHPYNPV